MSVARVAPACLLLLACGHKPAAPPPAPPPPAAVAPAPAPARDLSTDRQRFFGESRCARSGLLFCEDFESGALDPAVWKIEGTSPVVDDLQKARGAKALHVVREGNGLSRVRQKKSFPMPRNRYYGRAFVYFEALPAEAMRYSHWTIIAATG